MERPTKEFSTASVLTVITGTLLTDIGCVYEILNWMTGDDLYTHQLPRASRECTPELLKQFPQFASLPSGLSKETWKAWLDGMVAEHGQVLSVAKLPVEAHEFIDPMTEAAEFFRPDQIIEVKLPRGDL